jgi:type II secretory pathway component GspD/PulD (secretin)
MTLTQSRRTGARSLMIFAACLLPLSLAAQTPSADVKTAKTYDSDCKNQPTRMDQVTCEVARAQTNTIFLKNVVSENDANEIMVAVRNSFDPSLKVYLLRSQNALVVTTYPEDFARVEAVVRALDIPRKTYRVTYTLTELDAGKTVSTQHFSMLLCDGEHTTMKEGNKIPIATGTYANGVAATSPSSEIQTQFTYLDVGMNFDTTIAVSGNSVRLKSKVEDSSLDQPVTIAGVTEPVVRQSVLDGTSVLTLDKPFMLGTIDIPNTARHMDIAVLIEPIK